MICSVMLSEVWVCPMETYRLYVDTMSALCPLVCFLSGLAAPHLRGFRLLALLPPRDKVHVWLLARCTKKTEPKREWQRLTFKFSTIKCSTDSSLWYSVIGWAEYEIKSHAFPYHNIPHTFEGFPSPTVPWWLLACLWHRPPALLCPVVPPPGPKELLTREKLTRKWQDP